jgi:acyl-coenzyme A thioesterase PaaI-like protein
VDIEALRSRYDRCFGCGGANPVGLHLEDFRQEGETVTAPFAPRAEYSGFADTLHGGIVATALDEISAWSAIYTHHVLVFTATLAIRYRKTADADASFTMRGTVLERRGRRLKIAGEMLHKGTMVAQSDGLFIVAEDLTDELGLTTDSQP